MAVEIVQKVAGTPIQYATDSSGNINGLVGPDGKTIITPSIGDINQRTQKYSQSLRKSHRITGGRCVYRFQDHTSLTAGGTNIAHVTISTVSGANGISSDSSGSRTGSGQMVKLAGNGSATGTLTFTVPNAVFGSQAFGGRFGLWIFVEPSGSVPAMNVSWSPNTTITGEHNNSWNTNAIRPGWNFLTYVQGATSHPFGTALSYGGGTDLITNPVKSCRLEFTTLANCTVYLDSIWTGFSQTPSIVLGWDSADQDVIDYVLPAMQERGWRGYIAEPCFVWTSGSTLYDTHNENGARKSRMDLFRDAGWDIANHTTTHRQIGALANDYEIRYEIDNARAWQLAHGWIKGSEFYVSPQSSTSVLAETTIRNAGIVLQRHAKHPNVHLTQFGVDNPHHIGSYDFGNITYATIKGYIDMAVSYGCDLFLFGHNTVAGGAVDGSTVPGVSTQTYLTTLILMLDYIKSLESQGTVVVSDGLTGWYYG